MEYNFSKIEQDWKKYWKENNVYKVSNDSYRPKYYILDMFPYPSGAGLHVGHPLGYIASDIYARYKRMAGYNVLHPMGYDAFGLPAEQYALETGQHPAVTTEKNIARYREQLDNIGFCYDWSREVRTSDPKYYKWTQWIFLQLFHSWYDRREHKTRTIATLIAIFEKEGNVNTPAPGNEELSFDATAWKGFTEKEKRDALMHYRVAYQGHAEVWWCEALGTVLANDEVVNGVSERGGHPVERKQMRQWFLRITEYAERLLNSLDTLDWSEAMKEMQRNWIGKSKGAEVLFRLTPPLSKGEGDGTQGKEDLSGQEGWQTADRKAYSTIADYQKELKNNLTEAENTLWQRIRNNQLGAKFRRQHVFGKYIADFICLPEKLVIEIDGKIHDERKEEDAQRTAFFKEQGYRVIRFTNDEVIKDIQSVVEKIKTEIKAGAGQSALNAEDVQESEALSFGEGLGEAKHTIKVFTTRPDTIFGVDFMVLAPEHELVDEITTQEQQQAIAAYKQYVKSRSERERMSEVKQVTGCFTGAYAIHPFTKKEIPVWIAEYVLAGYGTGAIMAVPSGDDRDHAFAKHFNIPITNIFGDKYNGEEAYSDKGGKIAEHSDFLNGMDVPQAIEAAIDALVKIGVGKKKVNYKLRDAGFSRQRYWGEPFPIIYVDDVPYATDEEIFNKHPELQQLPVALPHVDSYKPGPEGQGPLANISDWVNLTPSPSPQVERGANVPKYAVRGANIYKNARENRKEATEAENILWEQLRNRNIEDKFRRQHPVEGYIVDFVCLQKALVIEVDGAYHAEKGQAEYDAERTKTLIELGFRELRFTNEEVISNTEEVIAKIQKALSEPINKPVTPSPFMEKGPGDEVWTRETNTMPGYAGSSWYFLRYMDPHNDETFASKKATDYWREVDLYIGGTEHAVGHLLYSRMWTKALHDLGHISFAEPFKKLVNQGMIQGSTRFVYRKTGTNTFVSAGLKEKETVDQIRVDVNIVDGLELNIEAFKKWRHEYAEAEFILEDGKYICGTEVEKMSKRYYNVVNPDDIVAKFGADTFRMYEMFLGPIEMSKPWDTKGIEGVHRFLKKMWRMYFDEQQGWIVNDEAATDAELRTLHKTIKKISEDIERFSFNTCISQFMICVNELSSLNGHKRAILEPLAALICPFAPHLAEELWHRFGHDSSVVAAAFPAWEEKYVTENSKKYPVAVNGKTRVEMEFPLDMEQALIEQEVLADPTIVKWLEGKTPKKVIYVKGRMINVVV
jgi:leucyl-tRNA synthetase